MQPHRLGAWKVLLLFGLLGPPIGALSVLLWMHFVAEPIALREPSHLFLVLVVAYIYGVIPALVTGLVAVITRKLFSRGDLTHLALRLSVPAVISAIWSVALSLIFNEQDMLTSISFAFSGAIAALACGTLAEFRASDRPNISLKRTNQSLRD